MKILRYFLISAKNQEIQNDIKKGREFVEKIGCIGEKWRLIG